ncbi:MAG TPA: hypothetical protein VNN75_05505, partial [Stellaceae bacterium]|nr:hypothetical protein [Stellaceae bacterium]
KRAFKDAASQYRNEAVGADGMRWDLWASPCTSPASRSAHHRDGHIRAAGHLTTHVASGRHLRF